MMLQDANFLKHRYKITDAKLFSENLKGQTLLKTKATITLKPILNKLNQLFSIIENSSSFSNNSPALKPIFTCLFGKRM